MREITMCHMPKPLKRTDAQIYEAIRAKLIKAHCSAGRPDHLCCGKVTIDRRHLTLQCPLCGDLRANMEGGS